MSANFSPFIANTLNAKLTESHIVRGSFSLTKDEAVYTFVLASESNEAPAQMFMFSREDGEELVAMVFKPKTDKAYSIATTASKFYTSSQNLGNWIAKAIESHKLTTDDLVYDAEGKLEGVRYSGIVALFMSRCDAPARGRSSADNVLILDFGKGAKATALVAKIAAMLAANDVSADVHTRKEWAEIQKARRVARAQKQA